MPNSYFRFRQFEVRQDRCSMKVCTDACLFGSWVAQKLDRCRTVLDIGTGTGLLSLMGAQCSNARFDAVDIDAASVSQATENFSVSPWHDRLKAYHCAIQEFRQTDQGTGSYDAVISNPPFFNNNLTGPDPGRTAAMHDRHLSLEELFEAASRLVSTDGYLGIMLPASRQAAAEAIASSFAWNIAERVFVKQTTQQPAFRIFYWMTRKPATTVKESMILIRDEEGQYSSDFCDLLADYYLYLTKQHDEQGDSIAS